MRAMGLGLGLAIVLFAPVAFAQTTQQCLDANEKSIALQNKRELRAAQTEATTCAAASCPGEIRVECARRLSTIVEAIPTVIFVVKDAKGADIADVRIAMDSHAAMETLGATAIAMDPGTHTFTFSTNGRSITKTFVLREAEKNRREAIELSLEDQGTPPPLLVARDRPNPAWRTTGLVLAGAGVAGLVIGAVTGAIAASAWSSQQKNCASETDCANRPKALADHDTLATASAISTIGFVAGGVLLVTGGIVFFAAPNVGDRSAGLAIGGAF